MAITNGYTDLDNYKDWFWDSDTNDTDDDDVLETVIEAVSRFIDNYTGTRFFSATETRYFTPDDNYELYIDDLLSVTTLKTDEDGDLTFEYTWATTDYHKMPFNASLDSEPYTWLKVTPFGNYRFPILTKSVEIAGEFGYSSTTPRAIEEACLMGANRIMTRHKTPLGTSAMGAMGELSIEVRQLGSDPDFKDILSPYVKRKVL